MKQIKALACSNSQEILGRVTLNGKNIFNRSAYILVTNGKDTPKGFLRHHQIFESFFVLK